MSAEQDEAEAAPEETGVVVNLRDDGVLWMLNRTVFHPRGFALAVNPQGFITLEGDGSEPWFFGSADDPEAAQRMQEMELQRFQAFEALLDRAREAGRD